MAPPSGSKTASKAVSDGAGRLRVRHQALKLRSSGLVGGHDEAGDHLLVAGLVEADVEALALHRGDAAVAELLMEHAVAALEAAAERLDAHRHHVDERRRALAAPLARTLETRTDPRLAPGAAAPALAHELGRAHV